MNIHLFNIEMREMNLRYRSLIHIINSIEEAKYTSLQCLEIYFTKLNYLVPPIRNLATKKNSSLT